MRTEFVGQIIFSLGTYDADNQKFPIYFDNKFTTETLTVPLAEAKEVKANFSEAKITGSLGLLLNESNKAQSHLLTTKVDFRGKTYQVNTVNLTPAKASMMFFGNHNPESKTSIWRTYETEDFETYSLTEISAAIKLFKPFQENNIQKFLLVTQTEKPSGGCHACGAILGIAVFSKKGDYWKLDSAQKNAGEHGRFGEIDQPSLAKIGKDKYALKFSWGDMHQGHIDGGDYYITLDSNFREILGYATIETSDKYGEMSEYDIDITAKAKFIQGANPDYFDVKVVTTGRKAVKIGKRYFLKPYIKTDIYTYVEDKYKLVKK